MTSIIERLQSISKEQVEDNTYSSYVIHDRINHPYISEECREKLKQENDFLILNETLIDNFFNILDRDLIYQEKDLENILSKIESFANQNNINIEFHEGNGYDGEIVNKNTLVIIYPENYNNKSLIYLILHELSHYITNRSSNDKLKKFLKDPGEGIFSIDDLERLKKELEYFLSPAGISNWAFTLSLYIYEKNLSASQLYKQIKDDIIRNVDFTKSQYYRNLNEGLKPLYHLILYVNQLKILGLNRKERMKYRNRLMDLIRILDKYVKRLTKLFR